MRLGIFAKTFPGQTPDLVLAAARAAGYEAVQYNMACSGLPALPEAIPADAAAAVAAAAQAEGLAISAVSGTCNMIHPDPVRRAEGLRRLTALIAAAPAMGTRLVTLCTGTRDPDDMWRFHPANAEADAWADLCAAMDVAAASAEAAGVRLGIEPEHANVVDTAAKARRLIDELGSPSLGIVLDPANLIETAAPADRARVIAHAVDLLADRLVMAHAKDRAADGAVVAAGRGVVDFPAFIAALRAAGFDGDLVTHGLAPQDAANVAAFLAGAMAR